MAKTGFAKVTKTKKDLKDVKASLGLILTSISECQQSLTKCMKGDNTNAYWDGKGAYDWFKNAKSNMSNNILAYKHNYDHLEDFLERVEKDGKDNGCNGARWEILGGMAKNADKYSITLPSTLHQDGGTKDPEKMISFVTEITEKYSTLGKNFTKLANSWNTVANGCYGSTKKHAQKCSSLATQKAQNVQKQVANLNTAMLVTIAKSTTSAWGK